MYDGIIAPDKKCITLGYIESEPEAFIRAGSPFFLFYVYEVLVAQGRLKEVLEDIKIRWGEMLRYDCKTCWEVFPGFYEVSRTRSYCHSWSASPTYFIHRYALGVERSADGFDEIRLHPVDVNLGWCEGSIPTPHGRIDVRWSRESGNLRYFLRLPSAIRVNAEQMTSCDLAIERI